MALGDVMCSVAEQFGVTVTLQSCIVGIPGSNLGLVTDCRE
jgi:hypothetical protein